MMTSNRKTVVDIAVTLKDLGGNKVPIIQVAISGNDISPKIITPIIVHLSPESETI